MADGKTTDVSIQTLLESPQFKYGRRGNDLKGSEGYAVACILFKPSLLSRPTSQNGGEVAGFSCVHSWSDNIGG